MCYHILTQTGSVVLRSTVQRVINLEVEDNNIKELFIRYDSEIHRRLESEDRGYEGSKLDPQDWANFFEEDPDLDKELDFEELAHVATIRLCDSFT